MSDASASPPDSSSEKIRLQHELAEQTVLVQRVREELIRSQITVLELQDTVLQKETDKADAVSILGQAELVLEGKINYIFELDRVLNERIAAVQRELADARSAHEIIVTDLVQRLDQTNRALGDAHMLAASYAREAAELKEKLAATLTSFQELESRNRETDARLAALHLEKTALDQKLETISAEKTDVERKLHAIHQSFFWKITAPFRSLGRRKS
jgi:chromosome segregation ATPase